MRRPAVFFDRDNTLIVNDGYLGDPTKVLLIDGAAEAIARARRLGYAIVVFSNQSGVAHGMFTEESVHSVNNRLDELLAESNPHAIIDRHEFCPFHPDGVVEQYRKDSPLRKPAPGMILQATEKLALDLSRSWVIGDAPRDIEAGKSAGCRTILFHHPALPPSPARAADSTMLPDHFVESLKDALNIIEKAPDDEATPADDEPVPTIPIPPPLSVDVSKLENLVEQLLDELRKPQDPHPITTTIDKEPLETPVPPPHFSLSKLFAGIVQILALTILCLTYVVRPENRTLTLLLAIMLQLFTIALLIMDAQE
jgi:D-glycero-D-manno-heptose 1,7-bisphosphate phosphatase